MVNMCADEQSVTLTELINYAFSYTLLPDDMKKTEISNISRKIMI